MMFISKTSLVTLASLSGLLTGIHASPTGLQTRASKDLLFAKGGPSLDDIAIPGDLFTRRYDEQSIFAQCLIALVKLNPNETVTLWFNEAVGEADVISTNTTVKPYYMGDAYHPEWSEISVTPHQAQQEADQGPKGIEMKFGYTDNSAWWPYAMLFGAVKAGWWERRGNKIGGEQLAEQTLSILTGYKAISSIPKQFPDYEKALENASKTPFILEINEFDPANEALKKRRWERWVTVMAYDASTRKINYATSFHSDTGGITEEGVDIADIEILHIVRLANAEEFHGVRPPVVQSIAATVAAPGPTSTEGAHFG